jgi:hypothetical protein
MIAPGKFFPGNWRGVATGAQSIGPPSQIRRLPIQILTVIVGVMQSNMIFSNFIRPYLVDPLRKILARWGIVFFRFSSGVEIPSTLVQYLQNLSRRGIEIDALYSFDDEAQIQKELLSIFSADKVSFISGIFFRGDAGGFSRMIQLERPSKRFLVEIDIESCDFKTLANDTSWFFEADIILVRVTLGFFWSGKGDLYEIVRFIAGHGFNFVDALEYFQLRLLNAPSGRIVLVFEKQKFKSAADEDKSNPRIRRVNQALTFLSDPIVKASNLTQLAGRGSFGFKAGVLNPGAIAEGDGVILLARGEHIPWAVSKRSMSDFFRGWRPMLFELNKKLDFALIKEAKFTNVKESDGIRLEDFRLFRYQNQLFSNHSKVTSLDETSPKDKPWDFESMRIGVSISRVDVTTNKLTFLGTPTLDFPTTVAEKNWAMFEHQKELYLIYSFNPFHLLKVSRWPQLDFVTVMRQPLKLLHGDDQIKFRNSVNPVEYDQEHFLHVVHKVYLDKQYAFWAVLIEKNSLLPKMISARPLICGWKSAPASIIYACSVIARENEILIFGGLHDSAMGFWKIARSKLDENWIAVEF